MHKQIKKILLSLPLMLIMLLYNGCYNHNTIPDKPNILFISMDDMRPEFGCYGKSNIHSPNIDQLAGESVVFERAYCQQSVCSPSRISLMTGLRPDSSLVHDNKTHHRRARPEIVTLPQHFIQNGYHALDFGKIYHGHMGQFNDRLSWSEPWYYPPQNYTNNLRGYLNQENINALKKRTGAGMPNFSADATEGEDVQDEDYPDGQTVKAVLENLPRLKEMNHQGKPFFLAVGIEKPHLPFIAPKKYWDLYDRDQIVVPESSIPEGVPAIAMMNWGELRSYNDMPEDGNVSEEKAKQLIHGYHACVSYVDALVGQLVEGLKEQGLYENTIIVLWGDHGWKLGDYGDWCKLTNFELDTRVPLIMKAPGMKMKGVHTNALVELVDLYPTLADLAGIPLPDHLQGDSFKPLLQNPEKEWKEVAFSQFPRNLDTGVGGWEDKQYMGYSMRTAAYRYTRWITWDAKETVAEELYHYEGDNLIDQVNLVNDTNHQAILDELRQLFDHELKSAHLQGENRKQI